MQWVCLETFVAASSLSPESHKALSVPGWSWESRPKNRLSDKKLKATGGLGLKRGTERDFLFLFFLSSVGKMINTSQSQNDSVPDNIGIAVALGGYLCLFF